MKNNGQICNNNGNDDSHKNIEYSRAKPNGTIHTTSTYLNENYQTKSNGLNGSKVESSQNEGDYKSDLMPNGTLHKNHLSEERNDIEKQSNVKINSSKIDQKNSVIPQVIINDGNDGREAEDNKTLKDTNGKGILICHD